MNKRVKLLKEIAEVINRNSLEANFNDTPDFILAKVAVEAMENFAVASKLRDNWHGAKKPEAFDVPKEVQAVAEFFGKMFPGSKVEIYWSEMPKSNPRDKRRAKGERKGGNNGKK